MSEPDWLEVERVMAAALDLPEDQRASFISQSCPDRPEVRAEVESLLAAERRAGPFLEAKTGWGGMGTGRPGSLAGRRLGPYKLLEEIGRGGMGAVYRAERDDGQFKKQVAVKVTTAVINSPEMLRRFHGEQQILATLEHPNIARLLDAGVFENDLPYIVMEYVDGVPIHQYCSQRQLPVSDRLRLFRTICGAVHHAHQRLVVHRDLKPGNILVTAEGVPKLLDFGIAKILGAWPEAGLATAPSLLAPLTPDYASPEQVRGAPITTASDIYSLGVLLYELLTGQRPYRLAGKTLDEAFRLVCDTEPRRPSTAAPLPEDLDAIVAKAMRKEPQERYASAEELSTDIGRHLEGLPVWARRGSFRYLAQKFVGRHRLAAITALLVTLLIVASGVAIIRQARIAERERARAERRFNEVRQLANSIIFELHDGIAALAGATEVRKLLVTRALQYLDSLAREAGADASLQLELAAAYTRIGNVQGNPEFANLGDTTGALSSYEKARGILQSILAREPAHLEARRKLASLYLSVAYLHMSQRNMEAAGTNAREGLGIWQKLATESPGDEAARRGVANAHFSLATLLWDRDPKESMENRYKALETYQALLDAHPDSPRELRNVALAEKYLCSYLILLHEDGKALEYCRKAQELDERRVAGNPAEPEAKLDLSYDLSEMGTWHLKRGELKEALENFRRILELRRALADADPRDVRARDRMAYAHLRIAETLAKMGDPRAAVEHSRHALNIAEALTTANSADVLSLALVAEAHARIGDAEADLGRKTARDDRSRTEHHRMACASYRRALKTYRELEDRRAATKWEHEDAERVAQQLALCPAG